MKRCDIEAYRVYRVYRELRSSSLIAYWFMFICSLKVYEREYNECTIRSVKFHFIHKRNKMFYFSYIMIHGYPFLLFCLLKLFNWKHDANLMINNTIKTNLSWISITYLQSDINSMKRVNIYIKHHNQTDHQNIIHVWLYSIYTYMSLRSVGSCFCIFPYKWHICQGVVWECRP